MHTPRHKEHHRKQIALAGAFVVLALLAVIGNLCWENRLLKKQVDMFVPKHVAHGILTEDMESSTSTWKTFYNRKYGFSIDLPPGVILSDLLVLGEKAAENGEIPMFSIEVINSSVSDALNARKDIVSSEDIIIHTLRGKKAIEKFSPGQAPIYALSMDQKTFLFSEWEGLEVPNFEQMVESFRPL